MLQDLRAGHSPVGGVLPLHVAGRGLLFRGSAFQGHWGQVVVQFQNCTLSVLGGPGHWMGNKVGSGDQTLRVLAGEQSGAW